MIDFYLINKSTWHDFTSNIKRLLGITTSITTNQLLTQMGEKTIFETQLDAYIDGTLSGVVNYAGSEAIRGYAFYNFTQLDEFNAPDAISIGQSAFKGCTSLKKFNAPRVLTMSSSFDEIMPMEECILGLEIELGSKNTDTQLSFYNNDAIKLVSFPNAKKINDKAFQNCGELVSAHFSSITSIGAYAFENCVKLESITAPSATTIGSNAFKGCTPILKEVSFPEVIELKNNVFHNCKELEKAILPKCTTIGSSAFLSCTKLKEVNLGVANTGTRFSKFENLIKVEMSNATTIKENAFVNCYNLLEASIPNANIVQSTAFANCSSLTKANYPLVSAVQKQGFYNCSTLSQVNLNEVNSIGPQAFENCYSLKSINLSKCTLISTNTFSSCSNLQWSGIFGLGNLSSIGTKAFENCTALDFVDIPKCANAGSWPFSGCTNLKSLIFGITSTNKSLFFGYDQITYIDLPSCTVVGEGTFLGCASLSFISLPKVTTIYKNAFEDCLTLKNLLLPVCSNISANAFKNCTHLKTLTLLSNKVVTVQANAFTSCDSLNKIYVPSDLYESYKTHSVWKEYENKIERLGSYCANKFEIKDQQRAQACFTLPIEYRDKSLNQLSIGTNDDNKEYNIQGIFFPVPMYRNGVVVEYGPKAYYNITSNSYFEGPKYIYDEESNEYYYLPNGCIMNLYYANNDSDTEGTPIVDFGMEISENLADYYWWVREINPPPEELELELIAKLEELKSKLEIYSNTLTEAEELDKAFNEATGDEKTALEQQLNQKLEELEAALAQYENAQLQYEQSLEKYKEATIT